MKRMKLKKKIYYIFCRPHSLGFPTEHFSFYFCCWNYFSIFELKMDSTSISTHQKYHVWIAASKDDFLFYFYAYLAKKKNRRSWRKPFPFERTKQRKNDRHRLSSQTHHTLNTNVEYLRYGMWQTGKLRFLQLQFRFRFFFASSKWRMLNLDRIYLCFSSTVTYRTNLNVCKYFVDKWMK